MFRLVKVINSHTQCETHMLERNPSTYFGAGCALTGTTGYATSTSANSCPDYISAAAVTNSNKKKIPAILVTEDMVFKVEYTGALSPAMGMAVGLTTIDNKMDAVTYNSSGKGSIIGIDDDSKFVYVKFRK